MGYYTFGLIVIKKISFAVFVTHVEIQLCL